MLLYISRLQQVCETLIVTLLLGQLPLTYGSRQLCEAEINVR